MSMLKKATNKMAYAKVGLYGDAGSGKTFTAAHIAIGLHQFAKLDKPIAMFDTEPAASFIVPYFESAGIDFFVFDESRALADLMAFMDEAERDCSIVIIDSITHIWRKLQQDYLDRLNEERKKRKQFLYTKLEFQHWGPIKEKFNKFTDRFLSSKLHAIVCGRAGSIYEYQENDQGKRELITVGTKMASEKEMGYEPSLLIEMTKVIERGQLVNRAFVEKDRADRLNGQVFNKPKFSDFQPHFEALNIGGEHFKSMETRNSGEMFDAYGEESFSQEKRQREIWCEEIKGLLIKHGLDGSSAEAKGKRVDLLQEVFDTASWTKVENMHSDKIKAGYELMKSNLERPAEEPKQNEEAA